MRSSVDKSLDKSYPEILRTNAARFERYRNRWLSNDPESFIAINRFLSTLDVTAGLGKIRCPTLVVGCEYDTIRTPEMSRQVAKKIPSSTYIEAPTGHFMAVQTPDLFIKIILPFLLGKTS
jgi:3-oxoadipate enol-lactonase